MDNDNDANGKIINPGEGVVREFPILKPGESFEYTSGTPLKTTNGIMQGYTYVQDNGEQIKIDIQPSLIALIIKIFIKFKCQFKTNYWSEKRLYVL